MTFSIRAKLLAAFGLNLFLLTMLGSLALFQLRSTNQRTQFLATHSVPSLDLGDDFNFTVARYQALQAMHSASRETTAKAAAEDALHQLELEMAGFLAQYEPLIADEQERAAFQRIATTWPRFVSITHEQLFPASRSNDDTRTKVVLDELAPLFDELAQATDGLTDAAVNQAEMASAAVQSSYEAPQVLIFGGGLVAFVCAGLVGFLLAASITRNVRRLTVATAAVIAGTLNHTVDIRSKDELGTLANGFNEMVTSLRSSRAAEAAAREKEVELRDAEVQSRQHLEQTVAHYLTFAQHVAKGDLTQRLDVKVTGALGQLGDGLNGMVASLHAITQQAQVANQSIAAATAEILAATTQQAANAVEQSAALTQTSTTVEEVRIIAQQTAHQTAQIVQDSQAMLQVARHGTQAVEETVSGMGQIRERVESIAETILALAEQTQAISAIIVSVSELADQSNLLALNAAIEAARAGEQGKSFAVVAQHVRELAQRSKAATVQVRDILGEIQRATNAAVLVTEEGTKGVEAGGKLASQAGQVIHRITGEVEVGAQANVQIAAAAQQQMTGMEQIGQAMTSIQQATTQTLASTRQAERAARDLHALSQSLQSATASYRL